MLPNVIYGRKKGLNINEKLAIELKGNVKIKDPNEGNTNLGHQTQV